MSEQKKRPFLPWILVGVLVITNIITILLWQSSEEKIILQQVVTEKVTSDRDNIKADLLALKNDYETLQTTDAAMQKDIDEKKARIEELLKEAEKHKNDAYMISKLKKEMETLRGIMMGYVRTIDSLNTLNQTLVAEKKTVLKKLDEEKQKQTVLVKEKDELKSTIAKGSILSSSNLSAMAVTYRRGGKKEVQTSKASKVEKIKVSFTLGQNKIARAGERVVYVRIMTPDGKEMAKSYDESNKFSFDKSSGYYAGKAEVNYANAELSAAILCEGSSEFVPGNYIIEICCDGAVIGTTNLKLD